MKLEQGERFLWFLKHVYKPLLKLEVIYDWMFCTKQLCIHLALVLYYLICLIGHFLNISFHPQSLFNFPLRLAWIIPKLYFILVANTQNKSHNPTCYLSGVIFIRSINQGEALKRIFLKFYLEFVHPMHELSFNWYWSWLLSQVGLCLFRHRITDLSRRKLPTSHKNLSSKKRPFLRSYNISRGNTYRSIH